MEEHLDQRPSKRARVSRNGDHDSTATIESSTGPSAELDPREIQVGITAFVSPNNRPFTATLKKRYTDFLVNEVLPNGQVVHLSSTAVPEKFQTRTNRDRQQNQQQQQQQHLDTITLSVDTQTPKADLKVPGETDQDEVPASVPDADNSKANASNRISEEDKQQLIKYLNAEAVSQSLSLYQSIIKHPHRKPKEHPFVRTEFTSDRTVRVEIHNFVRNVFFSRIETSTDKDGFLVLTATNSTTRQNRSKGTDPKPSWRPGKVGWAERGGEFLHFTLYKENKDTMEAISYLVRQMKVNAKIFQFAGTKDRRAVTAQRVSAHRMDVERLAAQSRSLRGSKVGDFEYHPHGLELGDLIGNEFTITLRDCHLVGIDSDGTQERLQEIRSVLERSMNDLEEKGYLNYFGLQRFGTFATSTDTVGLHILKGDFQAAIEAILDFDPSSISNEDKASIDTNSFDAFKRGERSEDTDRSIALSIFRTTANFHKASDMLPRKFSAESSLMRHLARQPADYVGALMNIPRNLRLMYVHAYQSLVWNNAITQRIAKHGTTVVEGDLVLISEHRDKNNNNEQSSESGPANVDADGEIIITPAIHDRANTTDDAFERARHLTKEEATSGQYSIFDVVLPLPGYDILYPDHETGAFYKSFMAAHGNLDPMDMRRKQRDFSLSGSYRKMLSCIGGGWTVDVKSYTRDEEQFVRTDLDILRNKEEQQQHEEKTEAEVVKEPVQAAADDRMTVDAETGPEKVAAILKFKLGSGQYATMALRELSRGGIVAYQADFSRVRHDRS